MHNAKVAQLSKEQRQGSASELKDTTPVSHVEIQAHQEASQHISMAKEQVPQVAANITGAQEEVNDTSQEDKQVTAPVYPTVQQPQGRANVGKDSQQEIMAEIQEPQAAAENAEAHEEAIESPQENSQDAAQDSSRDTEQAQPPSHDSRSNAPIKQEDYDSEVEIVPPKNAWFRVVIGGSKSGNIIRVARRNNLTFDDLRKIIVSDGVLPTGSFYFTLEAGGADHLTPAQEKTYCVDDDDFDLMSHGDGSRRNPYHVFIVRHKQTSKGE